MKVYGHLHANGNDKDGARRLPSRPALIAPRGAWEVHIEVLYRLMIRGVKRILGPQVAPRDRYETPTGRRAPDATALTGAAGWR